MDKTAIIAKIAEISETDVSQITEETKLSDLEHWDSLAYVVFVGFAVDQYSVRITANEMTNAVTVGDLINLVESKR